MAEAAAGRGRLALIGGVAGIGKTTLARTVAAEAAGAGALVLEGGCYDLTATPPYGPWCDLATSTVARDRLPALLAALGDVSADGGGQAALFDRVGEALATAGQRPLVILLDDIHWADPASLDLLRFLARRIVSLPLLAIATYRSDELSRGHALAPLLPLLVREAGATRIDPRPLDDAAVGELVGRRWSLPPAAVARLVAHVQRQAEGNPFYAEELLRALAEAAVVRPRAAGETGEGAWLVGELDDLRVPPLLRQIIDDRVARLGEAARQSLALAAVIGQEVSLDLWAEVGDLAEDDLLDLVERAVEAHLLEATSDGAGVRFAHALIREALYDGILPPRRRVWHRRLGEALATAPDPEPDAVAYHFRQAGDPRGTAWLVRAGERAQRAYAWLTAADRFEAAQRLLARQPDRAGERGWLLYRAGRLLRFTDPAAGVAALEEAEGVAGAAGDPVLAAYAMTDRGNLRCLVGDVRRGLGELEAGVAALDALPTDHAPDGGEIAAWVADALPAHAAVAAAPVVDADARGGDRRRGTLVVWLASVGRHAEARAVAEPLVARIGSRPAGTAGPLRFAAGDAAYGLGLAYAALGRPEAARAAFAEARAPARATGHHFSVGWITARELSQVILPYHADRLTERTRVADEAEAALTRAGAGVMTAGLSPRRAALPLLLLDGRWEEARRLALAARDHGTQYVRHEAMATLALLALGQGDHDLAWTQIHEVLPDGPETEPGGALFHVALDLQRVAADLALADGDLPVARAWLTARDRWRTWSGSPRYRPDGSLGWARYHRVAGDPSRARGHAAAALAEAEEPRQPLALLTAHRLLGEAETDLGRHAAAEHHLDEVAALAVACAAPYERVLTLLARAELRAAAGRPAEARGLLDDARSLAEPLAAAPALARAEALAARLTPRPAAARYPSGLSGREVEVLRLVAEGLSNPEVADRLSIGRRTVAQHLSTIYGKLGVGSRTAAARVAAEHGLL